MRCLHSSVFDHHDDDLFVTYYILFCYVIDVDTTFSIHQLKHSILEQGLQVIVVVTILALLSI